MAPHDSAQRTPARMTVEIEHENDTNVCVARLRGEVDVVVVPEVREALDATIRKGCRNLVLDLTRVTYADSSALGLLVWIDHRLAPAGGKLVLVGANRDVTRVLELSGLVGVAPSISASPTVSSALHGLELLPEAAHELWSRTITLPARIDQLSSVRQEAVDLLEPLGMPESALFDVKVAIGEALANAVRHGSPSGAEDEVAVKVTAYEDRVVICVTDRGCGFTGDTSCTGDVYASGGRGVMFMRALMDRVDFEVGEQGGTCVTLVKHLLPEAAPSTE
jgi:anti-anti-sigma factor